MTATDIHQSIKRVVVLDDEEFSREVLANEVEQAGFQPVRPKHTRYDDVGRLVGEILSTSQAAVCDHRLQEGNYAPFFGAEVVAALYDRHVPALLMTDYGKVDSYGPIRTFRRRIPVLLRSDESTPETLIHGFALCKRELEGHFLPERKARRTIVVVDQVFNVSSQWIVEAFIPGWDPHEPIQFPLDLIAGELQSAATHHATFAASINIGAARQEDLFLNDFSVAPSSEEDLGDG